ncbi:Glucosamine kinase [Streptomyces fumanus]
MIVNEPVPDTFEDTPAKDRDPDWFKRAVFYEVLVRSFQDSNGDGVGDLRGLTAKLDYLQWLGVDCLWLPPFFKSPLRDGGYDVSDYTAVLPEFGDLADFVEFVDAAHQRGMRVIIDFVMNHTSDQHPWFQESRKNPDGPYGDYYVWADDDKQYQDARIIFVDTEASNWTYDPVRKQYYWHRFFSHQPDLNYENPAVQEEMISALARALPTVTLGHGPLAQLVAGMTERLEEAVHAVPALLPYASGLRSAYTALGDLAAEGRTWTAQRVHGDLHLGQCLRSPSGQWSLIDFEGEPARPMAERRLPQPPVRDIAGMLRSFDYAAHSADPPAPGWAAACRAAYCTGYAEVSGTDPRTDPVLLRAYETDKAVYEVVYEARHRPDWLPVPMSAVRRLAAPDSA